MQTIIIEANKNLVNQFYSSKIKFTHQQVEIDKLLNCKIKFKNKKLNILLEAGKNNLKDRLDSVIESLAN